MITGRNINLSIMYSTRTSCVKLRFRRFSLRK
ncbi:hypothetical protein E2C01_047964 [Portunus trituberculatus]|uniref:Uncharacterized protein n=1 Tax=Portunus trituberculatus TaxID=210409 RepID=A0A5B7G957_PORTR|nr:hypothetical protein [Portunus trituberculatus]